MSKKSIPYIEPTDEEVTACAYFIWEAEGRPPGREIANWFQAKAQLTATRKMDAGLFKTATPKKTPAKAPGNASSVKTRRTPSLKPVPVMAVSA